MHTLRRLIRDRPIVIDPATPISTVVRILRLTPGAVAVLLDASFVLCGTLALHELTGVDDCTAEAIVVHTPALDPETGVDAARSEMLRAGTDRVLVVAASGQLLGVVTREDLARVMVSA